MNDRVQLHVNRGLLRSAKLFFGPETAVLEIGSGFGFLAQVLRTQGVVNFVGVEPTESLRLGLQARFPDLRFVSERMPRLSVGAFSQEQAFDVAIAVHVIEHANDPREALEWLKDIARCLKPETGRLVLVTPDISSYKDFFWSVDYTHSCPFSIDSLPQLMKDAGF